MLFGALQRPFGLSALAASAFAAGVVTAHRRAPELPS